MVSLPAYGSYPGIGLNPAKFPSPGYQVTTAAPTLSPAANDPSFNSPLGAWNESGQLQQTPLDRAIIGQALNLVGQIRNLPLDEAYVRHMGINPPFQGGWQALKVILDKNIRVEFGDMGDSPAHAQWVAADNLIMINQRYRGDTSPPTLKAISEAIYHEAGHAKDNDDQSSIQEELECLSLNTLAHRYHEANDPSYAQTASSSRLISDGVAIYSKLFFDTDPFKQALVNRVITKYGDLPMWSPGHPVPPPTHPWPMAYRVAQKIDANNVTKGIIPISPALDQDPNSQQRFPTVAPIPQPQAVLPGLPGLNTPPLAAPPFFPPSQDARLLPSALYAQPGQQFSRVA
ncbi:MAG TPA: hypothetical protein V6C52_05325 [Coleofasciculaceae cyanobacterium]|jgi:hypothetical protein